MNPYLIIGALVAVIVAFIVGGVVGYEYRAGKVPAELLAQQNTDVSECQKVQQVTKVENDKLQKDRDDIAAQLALSLRQPSTCVRVASSPVIPSSGSKHADHNGNGLNSSWLRQFAATCESYRTEVMVCTDFLAQERAIPQQ